ncbi:MAG: hydantoinase B/oxoprolinase family protein [Gemmatimonadota bacterium]
MSEAPTASPSGVSLEIYRNLFSALAEEMGAALRRAAHSPNIKERRDYSCALFSPLGQPVAMGDHMPVHLGAMPMSVSKALETLGALAAGDVACVNDPFQGGTHLPDITLVSPVFMGEVLLGYVASRAHHADVGGIAPGSMPLAREIVQEGLRIPPIRLVREGVMEPDLLRLILANVRTPEERRGDLEAQLASLHTGSRRLREMAEGRGSQAVLQAMDELLEYADRLLGEGLARIPAGSYSGEDWMEDDGFGHGPVRIQVKVTILPGGRAVVDFHGSSPQVPGGINAVGAITHSATRYVLRCLAEALLGLPLPAGGGSMERVDLRLPPGSVVNARFPASVAAGNVETSQRITDVLFRAMAPALPNLIPALSQGTMNNLTVGGLDLHGSPFAYYETAGGGMGGGPQGPGLSGVHTHMSNSLNTPVEALEHAYPFRLIRYGIRKGSGGGGKHPGGDGLERELELLVGATVTILSERRAQGPSGLAGGKAGAPGQNALRRNGVEQPLPGKVTLEAHAGDVIVIRSPGGGGWGSPASEPPGDP